jgi:DNA end-binding protein Ku
MAPRPHWKGFLKLSLVSCPIALYPAVSPAERISFRQVNKRTGNRVRHQLVDAVTGEAIAPEDKGRGYEVAENQFVQVEEHELEQARLARAPAASLVPDSSPPERPFKTTARQAERKHREEEQETEQEPAFVYAKPENNRTIEIDRFFPVDQLDARYFDKPYYVVPRDEIGQEAFAVIRDAIRNEGVVGLGRVVLSSRERPILLEPMGLGLRGVTLRFNHEVREGTEYFNDIPEMALPNEMMRLAQHIIQTKAGDFDPATLEDHYRNVLLRTLRKKQPLKKMAQSLGRVTARRENVISIMDALKRSIASERKTPSRNTAPMKRAAKGAVKRAQKVG